MKHRIFLLFGARGQLGTELAWVLSLLGSVIEADQAECDLCDEPALRAFIRQVCPTLIVNAAAYTAVDKAESERALATKVNATAPGIMAEEAALLRIPLVHYSTDYVYDGRATTPYTEEHPTAPLSVYGRTKRDGDAAIVAAGCSHLVFRTTWVYGHHGANFVRTILRLARTRDSLNIVNDQYGAPTWARLLAEATALAIQRAELIGWDHVSGIYHVSAAGRTNWCEFAETIVTYAQELGLLAEAPVARIAPTTAAAYGAAAPRPENSVLDNGKLAMTFGFGLPDWKGSLRQFLADPASRTLRED
ncbi:MAG: dTDP-4-dehydrorhamnose reductase [Gammaproteobacteria bacterium]